MKLPDKAPQTAYISFQPFMENDFVQAIEHIEKSQHIGIVLPPTPDVDCLVSTEALIRFLSDQRKDVGIMAPARPECIPHKEDLAFVATGRPLTKEFIISVDITASPVAQLRYENKENKIDIILSPQSTPLKQNAVSFKEGKLLCDCIITIATENFRPDVQPSLVTSLPSETPIINIDISPQNKKRGLVNLVDTSSSSLAEIVYRFLAHFSLSSLTPETSTLLLSGIISQTDGFRKPPTTPQPFLHAYELMRAGALYPKAYLLAQTPRKISLVQLFGRASIRSKTDPKKDVLWSFITEEDFSKTQSSAMDILPTLSRLAAEFPPHRFLVLLWQHPEEHIVHAHLHASQELLDFIHARTPAEFQHTYLELQSTYTTFLEAEQRVTSLLDEVL